MKAETLPTEGQALTKHTVELLDRGNVQAALKLSADSALLRARDEAWRILRKLRPYSLWS